ncbi:MAG: ABC transporter permease [bacterium]|nr:ABC transporter permease [bacterium]
MIGRLLHKDMLRRMRNPGGFILLLIMPLLFAMLIGLAFGPSGGGERRIRITLLFEDRDGSIASKMLKSAFGQGELSSLFDVRPVGADSGAVLMNAGKASALLVVPAGFGDSLLNRRRAELFLVKNPSESFGPKIAEETVRLFAEAGDRFVRIAGAPLENIRVQSERKESPSDWEVAAVAVQFSRLVDRVSAYLIPPKIDLTIRSAAPGKAASDSYNLYADILSGLSVMCLLFILDVLSRDIHEERQKKTLLRLRAGPASVSSLVAAKILFVFLSGLAAHGLVWGGAAALFGVRMDARQLLLFLPFSMVLVAALTGVVFMVQGLSRTLSQAQAISPAVIITFSMLGGSMLPVRNLPGFLQKAAALSPVTWGVRGLQGILLEHAGPAGLLKPALILSLLAWCFLVLSFFLLRRKAAAWA